MQQFLIFIQVSIFQKFRSWRFTFHIYKYLVQITVVNLSKLRLDSANHFKMCYVAVIITRGELLVSPIKYNQNTMVEIYPCLLKVFN